MNPCGEIESGICRSTLWRTWTWVCFGGYKLPHKLLVKF